MTPEEQLIDYALSLDVNRLGAGIKEHLCNLILDQLAIGVGAVSRKQASGVICENYVLKQGRGNQSAVLWSGQGRISPSSAAFVNGVWAEILDYQDVVVDPRNNGHVAVVVVPAALAVAEAVGATGRQLLTSIAAGIEVTLSILRAAGRGHLADGRGFRTTNLSAPLGAAVACARLMGLDSRQTLNALGIAGACQNSGLMASLSISDDFSMDKDMVNGLSAQLGVMAAELAADGLTGSHQIISGERGLSASYGFGDHRALTVPTVGESSITRVALKKYPACYGVHSAVEATLKLAAASKVSPESVTHIEVRVKRSSAESLDVRKLNNHMAARFSLPYCVASAFVHQRLTLEDFEPPALTDSKVLMLMDRIEIMADEKLTTFHHETGGFPAIVNLNANGTVLNKQVDYPPGTEQNPISRDDLISKFNSLTHDHWSQDLRTRIIETVMNLSELKNIRTLTQLLS